jgi:hypothetical protein
MLLGVQAESRAGERASRVAGCPGYRGDVSGVYAASVGREPDSESVTASAPRTAARWAWFDERALRFVSGAARLEGRSVVVGVQGERTRRTAAWGRPRVPCRKEGGI